MRLPLVGSLVGLLIGVALAVLLRPTAAGSGSFERSTTFVCDLVEAAECDGAAACTDVTPEQIGLPTEILVDLAELRLVSTTDEQRTSPILGVEKLETAILLQGNQNGRAWAMVIDRKTGHLSATLADVEGAFVVAGACAPK